MSSSERKPRRWTPAEDETLREQVDAQQVQGGSRDWCQIALALPGRSNKDCRKRWHNSVTEGLKKGQWSKSEDQLLIHGVQSYSFQWTKVATCVSSRSADQCAKRWQQSLDPRLDRSEWRESEDKALLAAVESLGRHWKDIQEQYLPHRSKNCVKNRFSVLSRRNAIHLAPYDDSLGSSSSDPGTPLQLEGDLPLDFMTTSLMHNTTHGLYQQDQISRTRSVEMSWLWSGNSDPSVSLPASHFDSFDANLWPACPNVLPSQTLSSNAGQWNGIHTNTGTPPSVQYLSTSNPQMHAYSYPTHHPADSRGTQYVAPSTSSSEFYAPAAGSSRLPTHRGAYGHSYRGS